MSTGFKDFIEQLSKESRFDRKALQQIYEKKIFAQGGTKYTQYERIFKEEWDDWAKEKGTEDIADFFIRKGDKLFRGWLQNFFPFYTGNKQLILGFKRGGTPEDIIIHVFYRFSQDELNSIDNSLSRVGNMSPHTALSRVFLESFLAIRPIISKIVGYKYSLMVEESKFLKKAKGRILFLELIARPHE